MRIYVSVHRLSAYNQQVDKYSLSKPISQASKYHVVTPFAQTNPLLPKYLSNVAYQGEKQPVAYQLSNNRGEIEVSMPEIKHTRGIRVLPKPPAGTIRKPTYAIRLRLATGRKLTVTPPGRLRLWLRNVRCRANLHMNNELSQIK
jgi:hypothetical protein